MADKRAFREVAQLLLPLVYRDLWRPRISELMTVLQQQSVRRRTRIVLVQAGPAFITFCS
jgi:hypothetical protein